MACWARSGCFKAPVSSTFSERRPFYAAVILGSVFGQRHFGVDPAPALPSAGLADAPLLALILLLFPKTRKAGATLALALLLCLLSGNLLLKPLVGRIRPYEANEFVGLLVPPLGDFSFPSGHTFSCVATAFVVYHYFKKAGIFAWAAAALMAFSRLYLYVHYPSDVLGGLLLGLAAGFVACRLLDHLAKGRRQAKPPFGQRISVPLFPQQHRRKK